LDWARKYSDQGAADTNLVADSQDHEAAASESGTEAQDVEETKAAMLGLTPDNRRCVAR